MRTPSTTRYSPPPKRLTIPQVMRALRLRNHRRAYELVLSGALGDVERADGLHYTVAASAVEAYLARQVLALESPLPK